MTAQIFLLQTNKDFDELYTYIIPGELEDKIKPGVFVNVPFGIGDRAELGVVLSVNKENMEEIKGKKKTYKLKNIISVKEGNILTENNLLLCGEIRKKYLCTWGMAAKLMIPPKVMEKETLIKKVSLAISKDEVNTLIEGNELRNINLIKTLQLLSENGSMAVSEIMSITGMKSESAIETLKKKGYIEISKEKDDNFASNIIQTPEMTKPLNLNEEQKRVYDKVKGLIEKKEFKEILLFGVTSGGKTEVYMQLVEVVIKNGGKAVILVPEISLTPQMTDNFIKRFGNNVAVIHSRLSEGEKKREWMRMKRGEVSIAVGARSAVFSPFEKVDLFIIDEEQERTYKSDETPRYSALEVAAMRGAIEHSVVLYGSATPSVETFYRAKNGEIEYCEILHRATKHGLPDVQIVDMREVAKNGERGIFSPQLLNEMKKNVENKEQSVIFVQRRGYSKDLICEDCGKPMVCKKCNVAMTVHEKQGRLICHYCGNTALIPKKCPGCGSLSLKKAGFGTEMVEEELKKLFPMSKVVRMDMDTTSKKNGHNEALKKFRDEKADFLVGTQMIAKGHDFPGVTLVGVVSADSLLNIKEYTAAEKAFQLITQVCGRAGRGDNPGRVIIQGYNIDAYALKAAAKQDYLEFYRQEVTIRDILNYPPYCAMGSVVFSGEDDRETFQRANEAYDMLFKCAKNRGIITLDLLGPARCPMPKLNDKYRWRLTIKLESKDLLIDILWDFIKAYGKKYKYGVKEKISCHTEV